MLRQEHESSEQNVTPTNVYVTAKELNDAIAAIEARREAERRARADRISIDEAVRELQLDVTPEELLEQVQAQRAAQAGPTVEQANVSRSGSVTSSRHNRDPIFSLFTWLMQIIGILMQAVFNAIRAANHTSPSPHEREAGTIAPSPYEGEGRGGVVSGSGPHQEQPWWMDQTLDRRARRTYRKHWKRELKAQIKAANLQFFLIDPSNPATPAHPPMPIDLAEFIRRKITGG